jgi:hypothetical protein
MDTKAVAAFEEIKKLLEAASTDSSVSRDDYWDLVESTRDHCETVLSELEDEEQEAEASEEEEEEEEELLEDAAEANDDGKVGGS